MKPTYLLAALLAVGLAACETKVETKPTAPAATSTTTKIEVAKPAEAPTAPPASSSTTTSSTTVQGSVSATTPSGTAEKTKSTTITTETKK